MGESVRIGIATTSIEKAKAHAKKHCIPDGCWYFVDFNELRRKAEKLVMWLDEPQFNTDPGNPHTPDSPHQS